MRSQVQHQRQIQSQLRKHKLCRFYKVPWNLKWRNWRAQGCCPQQKYLLLDKTVDECIQKLVSVSPSNNGARRAWQHPEQVVGWSKKRDGDDYQTESLFIMQSAIERYLKEKNYPLSIAWSREFHNSQEILHVKEFLCVNKERAPLLPINRFHNKVRSTWPWDLILLFRQLVLQDFHQVVPHSFSNAWRRPWQLLHAFTCL